MSSTKHRGKTYKPYAFTELGVTMLATILKSEKAIKMNIAIVKSFINIRKIITEPLNFLAQLEIVRNELHNRLNVHDEQLNGIYEAIENLLDTKTSDDVKISEWENRNRIGFKK